MKLTTMGEGALREIGSLLTALTVIVMGMDEETELLASLATKVRISEPKASAEGV